MMNNNRLMRYSKGVILPVILVVLALMTLSGVALMRSTESGLLIAGNYAFQRDLVNQAESVIPVVRQLFENGVLQTEDARQNPVPAVNYFASIQPANERDIPVALLNIAENNPANLTNNGVLVRYTIERMCNEDGEANNGDCIFIDSLPPTTGGNALNNIDVGTVQFPSYRVSIWVSGPRAGETFVQTVIAI